MLSGMASIQRLIQAEVKTRTLIEQGGLPQPDEIEYGRTCIRLFWNQSKTAMVVDVDDCPDPLLEAADRRDDGLPPVDESPPTAGT